MSPSAHLMCDCWLAPFSEPPTFVGCTYTFTDTSAVFDSACGILGAFCQLLYCMVFFCAPARGRCVFQRSMRMECRSACLWLQKEAAIISIMIGQSEVAHHLRKSSACFAILWKGNEMLVAAKQWGTCAFFWHYNTIAEQASFHILTTPSDTIVQHQHGWPTEDHINVLLEADQRPEPALLSERDDPGKV